MTDREKVEELFRNVMADAINAEDPIDEEAAISRGIDELLALVAPPEAEAGEPREMLARKLHQYDYPREAWEEALSDEHAAYLARADELLALVAPQKAGEPVGWIGEFYRHGVWWTEGLHEDEDQMKECMEKARRSYPKDATRVRALTYAAPQEAGFETVGLMAEDVRACPTCKGHGYEIVATNQPQEAEGGDIDIVFDGPPSHESGRFVEVESPPGTSIRFGEWLQRDDGYWVLRFTQSTEIRDHEAMEKLEEFVRGEGLSLALEYVGGVWSLCVYEHETADRRFASDGHKNPADAILGESHE